MFRKFFTLTIINLINITGFRHILAWQGPARYKSVTEIFGFPFQIKLAQKNVDNMEKRKRERDEQSKRNTVLEEGEEELNLELREPPKAPQVQV